MQLPGCTLVRGYADISYLRQTLIHQCYRLLTMDYRKHSLLSKKKFGGDVDDYLQLHKFMDCSKLFSFDVRHRILLHNTYGIHLCIQKFGDVLTNSDQQRMLVRDIAAEHCKEDLMGVVPTINQWLKYTDASLADMIKPINPSDKVLKEFVMMPLMMSGLKTSLMITHSNFGVYLANEILGVEYALELAKQLPETNVKDLLRLIKLGERWQYSPDLKQLNEIERESN